MTPEEERLLKDHAARHLHLYIHELGTRFYGYLINNQNEWLCGHDDKHDIYWVTPITAGETYLPFPFTTLKWDGNDYRTLKASRG